jgi:hypothetical protein
MQVVHACQLANVTFGWINPVASAYLGGCLRFSIEVSEITSISVINQRMLSPPQ